jgi:hypothetical protein
MRIRARMVAMLAVGALLGGAQVVGLWLATDDAPRSEALALDDYCRHLNGARATAYQPGDIEGWRCSVWHNGVWGLELVDLSDACRWQRSDRGARLALDRPTGETATRRRLLCTE